jgi:phenylpropionate dioxygenase-like ring-hydroxylating dioxygenase large terminal subunit
MKFEDFWYIVALSQELKPNQILSRIVLGEWLVIFRDREGKPVALSDRCLHRNSRLSSGKICDGNLQCPYHGWVYNHLGQVIYIPAEGDNFQPSPQLQGKSYSTMEQDDYIYVRLAEKPEIDCKPFKMPYYQQSGWETIRVINHFANNITNCAENFINIPHTAFVHPGVFRTSRKQQLEMIVKRSNGTVEAEYYQENTNLGWYSRFLNFQGQEIYHRDCFIMPNITSVEYKMGKQRHLFITSQSIPESDNSTLVYTDVTYNYGIWNKIARPFVYWTAQYIINQDVNILKIQGETIAKYGSDFCYTPSDTIHLFIDSIMKSIAQGKDPRLLPDKSVKVTFWV